MRMIQETDRQREMWGLVRSDWSQFQLSFAGWSLHSAPAPQHITAAEMMLANQISHLISFNWDDLFERAYLRAATSPIPKVTQDTEHHGPPALWKLHGDVEHAAEQWTYPFDEGVVFDNLMRSLEDSLATRPASHALIVGYSESEPTVRDRLISWLESHMTVLRVRPNLPEGIHGGIPDTARRFFQRLGVYIELERRAR